jgi:hypothetical protein
MGLPPTSDGATQENCMVVVVIEVAFREVGGLGLVMITAPLPASEAVNEAPYKFRADTFAKTLDPQATR